MKEILRTQASNRPSGGRLDLKGLEKFNYQPITQEKFEEQNPLIVILTHYISSAFHHRVQSPVQVLKAMRYYRD